MWASQLVVSLGVVLFPVRFRWVAVFPATTCNLMKAVETSQHVTFCPRGRDVLFSLVPWVYLGHCWALFVFFGLCRRVVCWLNVFYVGFLYILLYM